MRAVLTYHSIDPSGSPVSVDPTAFRAQVRWLTSGRVRVLPLRELLASEPGEDAVALTFDDGLASFADQAAPVLLDAGLPVTVFVVTDHAGGKSDFGRRGPRSRVPVFDLIDWPRLATLAERGVEIGAHTRTHPDLTRLDGASLRDEIEGSAERLRQELGVEPSTFAYPFGTFNERAVSVVREVFELAVTTELSLLPASGGDPHRVPRLDMFYFRDPRWLEAMGTLSFDAYLALRRVGRRARRGAARVLAVFQ